MADRRETSVKIILDIYYAISTIRKVQHSKPSKEKIFNYLKKFDQDVNHDYFMINLENLINKKYVEVQEHGEQESLLFIKLFGLFLSYGVEKASSEPQTEEVNKSPSRDEIVEGKKKETELAELENFFDNIDINQNEKRNTNNICMLYERMLSNLQSETIFLREKLELKDDHFRDEISYLRKQLEECLHLSSLKRDDHDFVSYREILNLLLKKWIATTDEPPRDSNSINSINIHNNSNKGSAVTITNDDRNVSNNSLTETNRIETNKTVSSNGDSNSNKSGRGDGNANKKAQSKNASKKS